MNTYAENRACSEFMSRYATYAMGYKITVRVAPDPNPKCAANQQAAYGLAKVDIRAGA